MQDSEPTTRALGDALRLLPPPAQLALFLDLDGTLLAIAPTPETVRVPPSLPPLLLRVMAMLDGALAIVSGRPLAELDHLLAPARLPLAGEHGHEIRRGADVEPEADVDGSALLKAVAETLRPRLPAGTRLETKRYGLGLHYRAMPAAGGAVLALARTVVETDGRGLDILEGDHVVELRLPGADKGQAVTRLMQAAPFQGRQAVFVGDDVTDEDGIRAAQGMGGLGVAVGRRPSQARLRLPDVASVHRLLEALAGKS